eukprot:CAMPEP_0179486716 /NCGR_PEP_ID=MMETSP0799-20121207/62908_1 /TAXON_ID=46947 /ORGANISM="Geminigera cryophila, Strain CCMP2564" /LENGTH=113 /DNA_ID=CAMNT_0021301529 /DNA_START=490 /DNA_END=832 /DNA_ORIENTATION=-
MPPLLPPQSVQPAGVVAEAQLAKASLPPDLQSSLPPSAPSPKAHRSPCSLTTAVKSNPQAKAIAGSCRDQRRCRATRKGRAASESFMAPLVMQSAFTTHTFLLCVNSGLELAV